MNSNSKFKIYIYLAHRLDNLQGTNKLSKIMQLDAIQQIL